MLNDELSREVCAANLAKKGIQIFNVSSENTLTQRYVLSVNRETVAEFNHFPADGIASCLRRAADAIDCGSKDENTQMTNVKFKSFIGADTPETDSIICFECDHTAKYHKGIFKRCMVPGCKCLNLKGARVIKRGRVGK